MARRFKLECEVGRDVYAARDLLHDAHPRVCLKLLPRHTISTPDAARTLRAHLRALSQLSHPLAVPVLDVGFCPLRHQPYYAQRWLDGLPLLDLLTTPLPPPRALSLLTRAMDVAVAAEDLNLPHGDLRPRTLRVFGSPTDNERVALLDFGVRRQLAAALGAVTHRTAAAQAERRQFADPDELDRPASLPGNAFSWSAIAVALLTAGSTDVALAIQRCPPLEPWIDAARRADPAQRPTLRALRDALHPILDPQAAPVDLSPPADAPVAPVFEDAPVAPVFDEPSAEAPVEPSVGEESLAVSATSSVELSSATPPPPPPSGLDLGDYASVSEDGLGQRTLPPAYAGEEYTESAPEVTLAPAYAGGSPLAPPTPAPPNAVERAVKPVTVVEDVLPDGGHAVRGVLEVQHGSRAGLAFLFAGTRVRFGRNRRGVGAVDNDLVLRSFPRSDEGKLHAKQRTNTISGHHGEFLYSQRGVFVQDSGSTFGTQLDGVSLEPRRPYALPDQFLLEVADGVTLRGRVLRVPPPTETGPGLGVRSGHPISAIRLERTRDGEEHGYVLVAREATLGRGESDAVHLPFEGLRPGHVRIGVHDGRFLVRVGHVDAPVHLEGVGRLAPGTWAPLDSGRTLDLGATQLRFREVVDDDMKPPAR